MKRTLAEMNTGVSQVWEGPQLDAERFDLPDQQAYERYQELAADMEPKQAMAQAAREAGERFGWTSAVAREIRIAAACELYSRRQVEAFTIYRAEADRAWTNYQAAMRAADSTYDAAMAAAGTDYDMVVTPNA